MIADSWVLDDLARHTSNGSNPKIVTIDEMIGRYKAQSQNDLWKMLGKKTYDNTKTDYEFWDKLRRGKQPGYELGSIFAKPIVNILISSVLGDEGIEAKTVPPIEGEKDTVTPSSEDIVYTNKALNRWLSGIYGQLIKIVDDLYSLGDQYVIVNPDGSLSVASPEMVSVEYDKLDYRKPVKYTITSMLDDLEVKDIYTKDTRELVIKNISKDSVTLENGIIIQPKAEITQRFSVLIGRIPVVHLTNDRSGNELYGRPVYEALLPLFSRYNDLLDKALVGTELMGNPIPTLEGMDDVQDTVERNSRDNPDQYTDLDGTLEDRPQMILDDESFMIVGKGGQFRFVSPTVGFTEDVRSMLKILFLLMLEYARIPETAWGGEMGQARSTSVEQMKPFHQFIELKRVELERMGGDSSSDNIPQNGLLAILDVWLRMKALTDGKIRVLPTQIKWPDLSLPDEKLNLEKTKFAHESNLVKDSTTLKILNLKGVDDPEAEVNDAKEEADKRRQEFDKQLEDAYNNGDNAGTKTSGYNDTPMNDPGEVPDDAARAKQPETDT